MVPVVSRFFPFSPHLLKIKCMLPMVCHFVTRMVLKHLWDYPSNKMITHREHTCYFQTN
ncbi:hypothetical protein Hanom_Chr00s004106g01719151 [Helianthus anomalus]